MTQLNGAIEAATRQPFIQAQGVKSFELGHEIARCQREIAAAEAALLAGHPDVAGLCLALSDWSAELRILSKTNKKEFPMDMTSDVSVDQAKIRLAKMCLAFIRNIAARGVDSEDPAHVGYALQEISQVLFERTGSDERRFEPVPADQITGLEALHKHLDLVNSLSQEVADSEQVGNGFWA